MTQFRWRLSLVQEYSLDEQLEENAFEYLNWRVRPTHGPRLRSGTVLFLQNSHRVLGWPARPRPRWRTLRTSWRAQRAT